MSNHRWGAFPQWAPYQTEAHMMEKYKQNPQYRAWGRWFWCDKDLCTHDYNGHLWIMFPGSSYLAREHFREFLLPEAVEHIRDKIEHLTDLDIADFRRTFLARCYNLDPKMRMSHKDFTLNQGENV